MQNMRSRIDLNDASIRQQHRDIHDRRLRPKLNMYECVLNLSLTELTRREQYQGRQPPESEAMRARRIRSDEDYRHYASDGRGPVPLEYWTTVEPAQRRAPISAVDLRHALENRRSGQGRQDFWSPTDDRQPSADNAVDHHVAHDSYQGRPSVNNADRAGPSGLQQVRTSSRSSNTSQMDTDDDFVSGNSHRTRTISPVSAQSRSSIDSYVSTRQSHFSRAQRGVPMPPVLDRLPYVINRLDFDLIGRSEVYVRPPGTVHGCPMCGADHRMIRCDQFTKLTLRERWYEALSRGICLNCLRPGHSSFTCIRPGACNRCGCRHNSLLCKRHPANR